MIHVETKALRAAVAKAATVVKGAKIAKPILANLLLRADGNQLTILGSDLENSVEVDCPCDSVGPFETTLPASALDARLRLASGETMTISIKGAIATLLSNRKKWELPTSDPAEFPATPRVSGHPWELPTRALKAALRVRFAADVNSCRYALGGVCFQVIDGKRYAVSVDGKILAVRDLGDSGAADHTANLPAGAAAILERLLPDEGMASIESDGNQMGVTAEGVRFTARLLEGRFPGWQEMRPEKLSVKFTVHAGELADLCRTVSVGNPEDIKAAKFALSDGTLSAKCETAEGGKADDSVPVFYSGPKFEIELNTVNLIDFLGECEATAPIDISAVSDEKPIVLEDRNGYWGVNIPITKG